MIRQAELEGKTYLGKANVRCDSTEKLFVGSIHVPAPIGVLALLSSFHCSSRCFWSLQHDQTYPLLPTASSFHQACEAAGHRWAGREHCFYRGHCGHYHCCLGPGFASGGSGGTVQKDRGTDVLRD